MSKEGQILKDLGAKEHPNILKLHACLARGDTVLLVTELICGSDLETLLFDSSGFGESYFDRICYFTSCIVRAVACLHSHHIGHFDLKGPNIMVGPGNKLKLIDFGMAEVVLAPLAFPKESTAHYLAPEIMRVNRHVAGAAYDLSADAWSLGISIYYWCTGIFPFADDEGMPFDIYNAVLYASDSPTYEGFEHEDLKALTQSLLRLQPAARPTFEDLSRSARTGSNVIRGSLQ